MTTWSQSHTTNIQLFSNAQELALHFSSGLKKIYTSIDIDIDVDINQCPSIPLKCMLLKLCSSTISQSLILPKCLTISQLVSHGH